jgi:hypothetical protein
VNEALVAAAFGDRPDAAVPSDVAGVDAWLAAVTLGGQGHYARAAALLRPLLAGPPVLAALAGSAMASHLRQLGGHAEARRHDSAAARRLTEAPLGAGRTEAWVDVLLGLAADSIGLGRPVVAQRLHESAVRAAGAGDVGWRVTVRIEWLATEIALATDRPAVTVPHAERAVAVASAHGGTRHTVKSTMMLGAALLSGGTPDGRSRAEGLLTDAMAVSLTRGMLPLVWPCALLLAELAPASEADMGQILDRALTSIFARSDPAMRRISAASAWMPTPLDRSGEPTRTSAELTT